MKFDFIQICHVLEHVSEPYKFLKNIIQYLSNDGLIYIEVPQDRTNEDIIKFQNEPSKMAHGIHEHLNLYSELAVSSLGNALGLKVIYVGRKTINQGWTKSVVISGLFAQGKIESTTK